MGRAPCCEKVGLKKGRWTAEEDEILTKYIQANGEGSWRSLPKNAGLLRCGKSCRLRWINYLRTDLKRGNISAEEETMIIKLHASFGNRWSLIASHLPGRTDNEIKNYWNSHLSRKIYSFRSTSSNNKENPTVPIIMNIPPKRRGGRTSRWAMKKNKSYAPKVKVNNQIQSATHHNNEVVPLPPTPALESENLTMVMEDFMALEKEKEELGGVDGSSSKCSSQQKENEGTIVLNHEQREVKEDATRINDGVLCLEGEEKSEEILGPNKEAINGGGQLSFNDFMDTAGFVEEPSGVLSLTFDEERESNNELVGNEEAARGNTCTTNKMVRVSEDLGSSVNQSTNGESGELCSCSSMASGLDELEWDWESVIQFNGNDVSESSLEQKENLLTWLWEDDDWKNDGKELGDIDPELDVMVAWFLS